MVVYFAIFPSDEAVTPSPDNFHLIRFDSKLLFKTIPIFVFAFTCHQNIFSVYNELEDNSKEKVESVISTSIGIAFGSYQFIGVIGYLTFGELVQGNIVRMCE